MVKGTSVMLPSSNKTAALLPRSTSVARNMAITVSVGWLSVRFTDILVSLNRGALSFMSLTMTMTAALLNKGGEPRSVALTTRT